MRARSGVSFAEDHTPLGVSPLLPHAPDVDFELANNFNEEDEQADKNSDKNSEKNSFQSAASKGWAQSSGDYSGLVIESQWAEESQQDHDEAVSFSLLQ
jgi:hypothetical protein